MKQYTIALTFCSALALATGASADYVLTLKPSFGCPQNQIRVLGACVLEANIPNQNNQGGNQGGNEGPGDNPGGNQGENPSTDPTTTCEVENCTTCVTNQSNACDTCDDGYHTQNGACVEDCTANACGTHETCNNSTHECECATGYTGDNCASCDENYHMKNNACVADCTSNSCDAGMGKTCNTTTHECECATGYTKSGDSCALCDRGTYKDHVGNDACSSCPGGTYSELGATSCTSCPAGTYETRSAPNGEYCTQCPANTYSAVGATACTPCPNNGTSPAGSTSESACVAAAAACDKNAARNSAEACVACGGTYSYGLAGATALAHGQLIDLWYTGDTYALYNNDYSGFCCLGEIINLDENIVGPIGAPKACCPPGSTGVDANLVCTPSA